MNRQESAHEKGYALSAQAPLHAKCRKTSKQITGRRAPGCIDGCEHAPFRTLAYSMTPFYGCGPALFRSSTYSMTPVYGCGSALFRSSAYSTTPVYGCGSALFRSSAYSTTPVYGCEAAQFRSPAYHVTPCCICAMLHSCKPHIPAAILRSCSSGQNEKGSAEAKPFMSLV